MGGSSSPIRKVAWCEQKPEALVSIEEGCLKVWALDAGRAQVLPRISFTQDILMQTIDPVRWSGCLHAGQYRAKQYVIWLILRYSGHAGLAAVALWMCAVL